MNSSTSRVRAPVPVRVLWKWTTVSAVLHFCFIGGICYSSYLQAEKRETALRAKAPAETPAPAESAPRDGTTPESPAAAQQNSSPPAADAASSAPLTPSTAAPAPTNPKTAARPPQAEATKAPAEAPKAAAPTDPSTSKSAQPSAEKILGIDKVAKPEDAPKGANPFSGKDDDLLKDLK